MRILVTGTNGFLAYELINRLCDGVHQVIAASRDSDRAKEYIGRDDVAYIANQQLLAGKADTGAVDVLIHTAFSREGNGQELCESLDFSKDIFTWAAQRKVMAIVNISSQSVYGSNVTVLPDEGSPVCPTDCYGIAKYASELLLESIVEVYGNTARYTNIRLASAIGPGLRMQERVFNKMYRKALTGDNIRVVGGRQRFSYIDIRDAVTALTLLLERECKTWKPMYNLGPQKQTGIVEVAETARKLAASRTGKAVEIVVDNSDIKLSWGMDSSLFYADMGWRPEFTFYDSAGEVSVYVTKSVF